MYRSLLRLRWCGFFIVLSIHVVSLTSICFHFPLWGGPQCKIRSRVGKGLFNHVIWNYTITTTTLLFFLTFSFKKIRLSFIWLVAEFKKSREWYQGIELGEYEQGMHDMTWWTLQILDASINLRTPILPILKSTTHVLFKIKDSTSTDVWKVGRVIWLSIFHLEVYNPQ